MRLSQDNGSRSTHCACRYLPLGPLVNCVKRYKFTIFDSKITFMVFHTPINVIEDRLDLYCHFLNDWWHNFCVRPSFFQVKTLSKLIFGKLFVNVTKNMQFNEFQTTKSQKLHIFKSVSENKGKR